MTKKWNVEMRESTDEIFDNWIGDYIEAETRDEAIELAKTWLSENGYENEVEFKVSEYRK